MNRTEISSQCLPAGQRKRPWRRFGQPQYAGRSVLAPELPVVTVTGTVRRPQQVTWPQLADGLTRIRQTSDLHCVMTWSAVGISWEGVRFRDLHERLVALAAPSSRAAWVTFHGLDGYRACLRLDDAVADNVLVATALDGAPLDAANGGPLRLTAPAQYGYKSVKHLSHIEYAVSYDGGPRPWLVHPRGRVAHEERSRWLPGWVYRHLWRALLPRALAAYDAGLARNFSQSSGSDVP